MFSLAVFRYRLVLAGQCGPIARIVTLEVPCFGRRLHQASAWLVPGLVPRRSGALYSDADGTGTHADMAMARRIAVSEALERWAYHASVRLPGGARFGFDVDCSSNGLAAFPALTAAPARRNARLEAIERFAVLAWWEERLAGELRVTVWPGVAAVAIRSPVGGVVAILHRQAAEGFHCYGKAAGASFAAASEKALVELARHEWILRCHWLQHGGLGGGLKSLDLPERRSLYFAGAEGYALFCRRSGRVATQPLGEVRRLADTEIRGPWSRYARVWRFAFQPPSPRFLAEDERYFFW